MVASPDTSSSHSKPVTRFLTTTAAYIDRLIAAIGRAVIWLALFLVLVQFAVVLLRYAFGIGSICLSESIVYAHAALFLLVAAWTLQCNGHARVDVFYAEASGRKKAMVDLAGSLLLLLPLQTTRFIACTQPSRFSLFPVAQTRTQAMMDFISCLARSSPK